MWRLRNSQPKFPVIPAKLAIASASRNLGNATKNRLPLSRNDEAETPTYSGNFSDNTLRLAKKANGIVVQNFLFLLFGDIFSL